MLHDLRVRGNKGLYSDPSRTTAVKVPTFAFLELGWSYALADELLDLIYNEHLVSSACNGPLSVLIRG